MHMKHNKLHNENAEQGETAKAVKKRPGFRPYIKNTVSLTCGLYKNDEENGPITQQELSASFRVRLIPLLLASLAAGAAILLILKHQKRR